MRAAVTTSAAATTLVWVTGGWTTRLGPLQIQATEWDRPLIAYVAAVAACLWVTRRQRTAVSRVSGVSADVATIVRLTLTGTMLASVGYWLIYLVPYCGGSDSYGYVSASRALLHGSLVQPQPIATQLAIPNGLEVATPAGWVPAADRSGIAPQYPLGLPALMAVAGLIGGPFGPFLVPVVCGIACLWLVHQLARDTSGALAAPLAGTVVGWSPVFAAYAKQPMSDVPAAACVALAAWALLPPRRATWVAGVATGASFLIRPGGIGACMTLGGASVVCAEPTRRLTAARRFVLGFAPGVVIQALLQWQLYGHPLRTGYGTLHTLYTGASIWTNLAVYARAIWMTQTPLWLVGVACALGFGPPRLPLIGAAVLLGSALPYVLYLPFDHWETLRFLLPGLVLLSAAAAGGVLAAARRAPHPAIEPGVALALGIGAVVAGATFMHAQGTPATSEAESRYPKVADLVLRATPDTAVVLAAQHSGSLRHYASRTTLRWDRLTIETLPTVLAALDDRHQPVYVVLEGTEQARFDQAFGSLFDANTMRPVGQVKNVRVWELGTPVATAPR